MWGIFEKEASSHERQFGACCKMDPKCFDLARINLLCLQRGVEQGFTLSELNAAFDRRGPVKTLYQQFEALPPKRDLIILIQMKQKRWLI